MILQLATRRSLAFAIAILVAAVVSGGLISVFATTARAPAWTGVDDSQGRMVTAPVAGCGPTTAPVADPNFVPVAGRFGPATEAYPPVIGTGEVISEASARQMADTLFPRAIPSSWSHQLYVRDATDRDADGEQEARLRLYLSPKPIGGNVLDYMEAGGVLLVQAPTSGVDAQYVSAEIADTGRRSTMIDVGEHQAIMYLADPLIEDDLRPWHLYWSDGTRDWSLQGVADPGALIELAQSIYC